MIQLITQQAIFTIMQMHPGVKVSRNAVPVPGNLSLEHSGCRIIGFYSQNLRPWAQQITLIR